MWIEKCVSVLALGCTLLFTSAAASAVEPVAPSSAAQDQTAIALTADDLNAWLDGYLPFELRRDSVAGAVVTIVKDGEVLTSRGFGWADIETQTPMDPVTTLMRAGSISKLFTWIAVMQLVERGELDLDANISPYLDFEFPMPRGTITLRHIMTHSAGFEEVVHDLLSTRPDPGPDALGNYLRENRPEQVFNPGDLPAYSNYATALAGYIVERASGMPFADYVERQIFDPLGMEHSTFRQPVPGADASRVATGYHNALDPEPQAFETILASPAGSLSITGADMARFMNAMLNDGGGLVEPGTLQQMFDTLAEPFPPLNSIGLGFWQTDRNGVPIRGHGGDTGNFHSDLSLLIDEDIGVFISTNSTGTGPVTALHLRQYLLNGFLDRYFPVNAAPQIPLATARDHGAALVGHYETSRRSVSNPLAALAMLGQLNVSMMENGDLIVPLFPNLGGGQTPWREVEPWIWQEVGGQNRMTVRLDDAGQVQVLAFEPVAQAMVFQPAPSWRSAGWTLPTLGLAMVIFVLSGLTWGVRAILRYAYGARFPLRGRLAIAHRLAPAGAVIMAFYVVAWFGILIAAASDITRLNMLAVWLGPLYAMSLVAALATTGLIGINAVVWRDGASWFARAWAAVLLLAAVAVVWIGWTVNFFSFTLHY